MLDRMDGSEQSPDGTDTVEGTVKWYDSKRGFGFVVCSGFEGDFLLHGNVLNDFGFETAPDGSIVTFRYESADKGHKITEVLSVQKPDTVEDPEIPSEDINLIEDPVPARVKWFDDAKGYGFVNCFGRAGDVFIGSSVMRSAGYSELIAGQALSIQVAHTDSGQRVQRINDWPNAIIG